MTTRTRNWTIALLALLTLAVPLATLGSAQSAGVTVEDNRFAPPTLTVVAGQTVTWTSQGSNPHTVTSDDGTFDSSPDCNGFADSAGGACLDTGEQFTFAFDEPGTYPYYCKLHGSAGGNGMAGTIVVQAASSDGGTTDGTAASDGSGDTAAVTGSLTVSDQSGDGSSVLVDSVTIQGADGFVVIHADGGGTPGAVIGHVAIDEGTTSDLRVPLDQDLTASATVWPMLHVDAGVAGTYEFPGADGPVMDADGVVVEPLAYTLASETGTLPRTGAPWLLLAAVAALAGAGGWVALRGRAVPGQVS